MELYKRHRPKKLKAIIGQKTTVRSLENMIERGTLPHTILFHGPSGCGKTTLARILKTLLNCHNMDFREQNCSSHRGIGDIRDIERVMNLAPTGGDCKIWLLDEVHRLTGEAQDATLKMLEDTPKHVYFFLCTDKPEKLHKPILTRCCNMPVRFLTYEELEKLIKRVAKRESIDLNEDVLEEIVSNAQGSARVALVLLDKINNLSEEEQIEAIQDKMVEENEAIELCRALMNEGTPWKKIASILKNIKGEPESIRRAVIGYGRAVLLKSENYRAYLIIDCFQEPFYDTGHPGLIHACYSIIHDK